MLHVPALNVIFSYSLMPHSGRVFNLAWVINFQKKNFIKTYGTEGSYEGVWKISVGVKSSSFHEFNDFNYHN